MSETNALLNEKFNTLISDYNWKNLELNHLKLPLLDFDSYFIALCCLSLQHHNLFISSSKTQPSAVDEKSKSTIALLCHVYTPPQKIYIYLSSLRNILTLQESQWIHSMSQIKDNLLKMATNPKQYKDSIHDVTDKMNWRGTKSDADFTVYTQKVVGNTIKAETQTCVGNTREQKLNPTHDMRHWKDSKAGGCSWRAEQSEPNDPTQLTHWRSHPQSPWRWGTTAADVSCERSDWWQSLRLTRSAHMARRRTWLVKPSHHRFNCFFFLSPTSAFLFSSASIPPVLHRPPAPLPAPSPVQAAQKCKCYYMKLPL